MSTVEVKRAVYKAPVKSKSPPTFNQSMAVMTEKGNCVWDRECAKAAHYSKKNGEKCVSDCDQEVLKRARSGDFNKGYKKGFFQSLMGK